MSDNNNWTVIAEHTRAMALADGALVAVNPKLVKEAGIKVSVALSAGLSAALTPSRAERRAGQSFNGRLLDLLILFHVNAAATQNRDRNRFAYKLLVARSFGEQSIDVEAFIGPGDNGEPALTIFRPEDDGPLRHRCPYPGFIQTS